MTRNSPYVKLAGSAVLAAFLIGGIVPTRALADASSWYGQTSQSWTTPGNWKDNGLVATRAPGASDDVAIGSSLYSYPVISSSGSYSVQSLQINGSGNLRQQAGTLTVSQGLTVGSSTQSGYTLSGSSTSLTVGTSLAVQSNDRFTQNGGAVSISGAGGLVVGTGTINTGGTYILENSGTLAIPSGGIQLGGSSAASAVFDWISGALTTQSLTLNNGGELECNSASHTFDKPLTLNGGQLLIDIAANFSTTGTLVLNQGTYVQECQKTGIATLFVNGGLTYGASVPVHIYAGTLDLDLSSAPTVTNTTAIMTIDPGAGVSVQGNTDPFSSGTNRVTITNNGTLTIAGGTDHIGSYAGSGTTSLASGNLVVYQNSNTSYSGALSGSGQFSVVGLGSPTPTLTLYGNNSSFTGTMEVVSGALNVYSNLDGTTGRFGVTDFGTTGNATVNQSATSNYSGSLYLGGASGDVGTYNLQVGRLYIGGDLYVGDGGTGTFNNQAGTNTVTGVLYIAHAGGSAGTYALSGTGTLAASGVVNNGTFTQSGGAANLMNLSGSGSFSLSGGTLSLSGSSNSLDSLSFTFSGGTLATGVDISTSAAVTLDAGGATFDTASGTTLSLSHVISGTGGVNKTSAGALALTATNTYAGTTTLSAGTLLVNGTNSGTGAVTLNGGTLGGSGSISGTVSVGSGGTIFPSATLSTDSGIPATALTVGGLTTNSSTTLDLNLAAPNQSSGGSDLIVVSGSNALTLNGGALPFTNHAVGGGSLGWYKVVRYSGSIQGTGPSSLTLPTITNNVCYVLDTNHDPGYVDVHRGFEGDANDDGVVNGIDLGILSGNFFNTGMNWNQGDFNGDGVVNGIDLGILAGNFFGSIGSGSSPTGGDVFTEAEYADFLAFCNRISPELDKQDLAQLVSIEEHLATFVTDDGGGSALTAAPVPEPASLAALGLGAVVLMGRRRRPCAIRGRSRF